MRHIALWAASLAAVLSLPAPAEAQSRRQEIREGNGPLVLNVRPRSFLDPGNVVEPGSLTRYIPSGTVSYLNLPPYVQHKDRFGGAALPDPVVGPFVGAENPFRPVDANWPPYLSGWWEPRERVR